MVKRTSKLRFLNDSDAERLVGFRDSREVIRQMDLAFVSLSKVKEHPEARAGKILAP